MPLPRHGKDKWTQKGVERVFKVLSLWMLVSVVLLIGAWTLMLGAYVSDALIGTDFGQALQHIREQ